MKYLSEEMMARTVGGDDDDYSYGSGGGDGTDLGYYGDSGGGGSYYDPTPQTVTVTATVAADLDTTPSVVTALIDQVPIQQASADMYALTDVFDCNSAAAMNNDLKVIGAVLGVGSLIGKYIPVLDYVVKSAGAAAGGLYLTAVAADAYCSSLPPSQRSSGMQQYYRNVQNELINNY